MKRIAFTFFLVLVNCILFGQNTGWEYEKSKPPVNPLKDLPKSFKYAKELSQLGFIAGGSFTMGSGMGMDSMNIFFPRRVAVKSLLIGKHEVSNLEYRQFVQYVRDSIAHVLLGHSRRSSNTEAMDWSQPIDWKDPKLEPMMIPAPDRLYGKREVDPYKINYQLSNGDTCFVYPDTLVWMKDFSYSYNEPFTNRYFYHPSFNNYPVVGVNQKQAMAYCDWKTRQWNNALNDKAHSFLVRLPFVAEWELAANENPNTAENHLSNNRLNLFDEKQKKGYPKPIVVVEGKNTYYRYNFGRITDGNGFDVKSYDDDGSFYTAPCNAYPENVHGLYNMRGNVAEWTMERGSWAGDSWNMQRKNDSTAQRRWTKDKEQDDFWSAYKARFPRSPLPNLTTEQLKTYFEQFIVVKGGSWESIPFYLQAGANEYYLPYAAHSYIGFRILVEYKEK